MSIAAVIFDCDGVLVDSEHLADLAVARTVVGHVPGYRVEDYITRFRGWDDRKSGVVLEQERGIILPADLHQQVVAAVDTILQQELRPMAGVREAVERIPLPKAVASNSPRTRLLRSLEVAGLVEAFAPHIYDAAAVRKPKPAPDLLLHAAERLQVPPANCLVIEDNRRGVQAARAAGMRVLAFLGGSHIKGDDENELLCAGALGVCHRMADLGGWLSERRG